jgi:hypothetical protein
MVHHRVAGPQQAGDGFRRVERAAAADADYRVERRSAQAATVASTNSGDGSPDTLTCSHARPRRRSCANKRVPASDSANERRPVTSRRWLP